MNKYIKEGIVTFEMDFVLNTKYPVYVKRSNGRITLGYFQDQIKGSKDSVVVAWTDEKGNDVGKIVPVKEFVELNSKYAYLLPQPVVIPFTFSPEQVEAFQQCKKCPSCFKNL